MDRRYVLGLVGAAALVLAGVGADAGDLKAKAAKTACPCCGAGCECAKCSCAAASKSLTPAKSCDCCKGLACCPVEKKVAKTATVGKKPAACCSSTVKTAAVAPKLVK